MNSITRPRVVVGLDDSSHAPHVLDAAATLARRLDLALEVVHSPSTDVFTVGERRRDVVESGERTVAQLVAGYEVEHVTIQPGPPADVLRASMGDGAVLGVVGSRGRGPLRAAVLGSVSAELALTSPVPLVVVGPGIALPDLDDGSPIVCRLDGSLEDLQTLRAAAWLTHATGAEMLAINLRSEAEDRPLVRVERELAGLIPLDTAIRLEAGDPIDEIHQVADRHGAAMIVVGSHGDAVLPSSVAGAVSARLVTEARRPIVVVSPEARVPLGVRLPTAHVV